MPSVPGAESFNGRILHSVEYQEASLFAGKRVLIVGAGNSGCDIACDAGAHADAAFISVRRGYYFIPKHIFGKPADVFANGSKWMPTWLSQRTFGWLLKHILIGDLRKVGLPAPDHKLMESHPIMNDQLIHNLRHGDVQARGDIERFEGDFVYFKNGGRERIDVVVMATGYNWSIPYMDAAYFKWHGGRPDLYLSLFNREHEDLFALGFMETDGGAYKLFDEMADMIAAYVQARQDENPSASRFARMVKEDRPALNGGVKYLKSDRHAAYVNKNAYLKYLRTARRKLGWPALKPGMFAKLRTRKRQGDESGDPQKVLSVVGGV
jgi:hypothetical protein